MRSLTTLAIVAGLMICDLAVGRAAEPVFSSNALVVGRAEFSGTGTWKTLRMNSAPLYQGSKYLDLAYVNVPTGNNLSKSSATLEFSGASGSTTKSIMLRTATNVSSPYRSGIAQMHTTASGANSGPGFVTVQIIPNRVGERVGSLVNVRLKASYRNTNIVRSTGVNQVQVAYIVGGTSGNLLYGADYTLPPGGAVVSNSQSFLVPIGGTFQVGMVGFSNAPTLTGLGADINLDIEVTSRFVTNSLPTQKTFDVGNFGKVDSTLQIK